MVDVHYALYITIHHNVTTDSFELEVPGLKSMLALQRSMLEYSFEPVSLHFNFNDFYRFPVVRL